MTVGCVVSAAMRSPARRAAFGAALAAARKRAGLSQRQLAQQAGVADTAISQYERWVNAPSEDRCERLEDALQLNRGDLGQHLGYRPPTGQRWTPEEAIEIDPDIHPDVKRVLLAALAEERRAAGER